ncbi:MAG: DUF3467 domain-containing protein [Anaerolineaceae bacterium]
MDPKETPPTPNPNPVDVAEELNAVYSNLVRISHSPSDVVLDFGQVLPAQKPHVISRIVMSPVAAKMFLNALRENLARYEAANGEIHIPGDPSLANDLFKQIRPPEPPKAD